MVFHHLQRHRNFFPLIIIFLSLVLCFFVVWSYSNSNQIVRGPTTEIAKTPAITENMYKAATKELFKDFWTKYESLEVSARLTFVEDTENSLLALKVPSSLRMAHLELVSNLEIIRTGLSTDPTVLEKGVARLKNAFVDYPWLANE